MKIIIEVAIMSCTEILQNLYLYHVRSASKVKNQKRKKKNT